MRHIELVKGMKVTYCPQFGNWQKGVLKSNPRNGTTVFVVYKCNNEWDRYMDFTGEETDIEDLKIGWHDNGVKRPTIIKKTSLIISSLSKMFFLWILQTLDKSDECDIYIDKKLENIENKLNNGLNKKPA